MKKSTVFQLNFTRKILMLSLVTMTIICTTLYSQPTPAIIPMPVSIKPGKDNFIIKSSTVIEVPAKNQEVLRIAMYLTTHLNTGTGYALKIVDTPAVNSIRMVLNTHADEVLGQEGYYLVTATNHVVITANTPAGLFYGVQTLLQLLPTEIESSEKKENITWQVTSSTIIDYPRFVWRGIMLDVSRHFFSKNYVKEFIDQLARYKYNRLHWHLTDDNGWRIEIKSFPKLTTVGAWRVPRVGSWGKFEAPKPGEAATDGGFYTQEDIKEIVQYAKDRYIEILPEVDVPGHSMAAIAAYPELSCTKDSSIKVNPGSKFSNWFGNGKFEMTVDNTLNPADEKVYQFLDKVFTEVAQLFPFEYIHIGGDECFKGYWEKNSECQALLKKMNLKDSEALQAYFTQRIVKIIASKNKKAIGWDEILEGGLTPGAAVMSWRGIKGGIEAVHQKHQVVMSPSPMCYLDLYQGDPAVEAPTYSMARLHDTYAYNPIPPNVDSTFILGGQGNLWTEHIANKPQVEYMIYPRAFATSEIFWSPVSVKNWDNFVTRVENHFARFDQARMNYATSLYDPIIKVIKNKEGQLVITLTTEVKGLTIHYTLDDTIPNQYYPFYKEPITLTSGVALFRVITYRGDKPVGKLISIKTEDLAKRLDK